MNLKYITFALGFTFLYFTPIYIINKSNDNTKEYFLWRMKILSEELDDIKKKLRNKV
jgi:hypothetical protein